MIKIIISKIGANRRFQAQRRALQKSNALNAKSLGQATTKLPGSLVWGAFLALFANTCLALPIHVAPEIDCAPIDTLSEPVETAKLVIIIDDLGNNFKRGKDALALPGKLNFAVMPYTPHGQELASVAVKNGKEVMLHAPMSTQDHLPLGKGGLTTELSREEFRRELNASLEQFPQIVGINNHMGSELTQQRPQMAWVMQELRSRDLYFVDSRTSDRSVAAKVAAEFNVPHLSRNVFLDNVRERNAIHRQFREAVARAHQKGLAVAIGHPYQSTIDYLRDALPTLEEQGIELMLVSEALMPQARKEVQVSRASTTEGELVVMQVASTLADSTNTKSGASKTVSVELEESFVENCLWEQKVAENDISLMPRDYDGT